ncbi:hypothetical protein [Akkermansia sp.]|uniref:hypothetical protein n=1 Tax=Akkermansia sp. TaxID=1872421 RepID=UPI003AF4EC72
MPVLIGTRRTALFSAEWFTGPEGRRPRFFLLRLFFHEDAGKMAGGVFGVILNDLPFLYGFLVVSFVIFLPFGRI